MLTFQDLKDNSDIKAYILQADEALRSLGYTEHGVAHATIVAQTAAYLLQTLDYSAREIELAKIAGYLHDLGNLINRVDHSQSGALLAMHLLKNQGMPPSEIAKIACAIGNHDEGTGTPVSPLAAALILADKSDVRRSRVRDRRGSDYYDIHDRVNYSVTQNDLKINAEKTAVRLTLTIDSEHSSIMEYFQIFTERMVLCREAAKKLNLKFELVINGQRLV